MQGMEIRAHAKIVDPDEKNLRLFLKKQCCGQDCKAMRLRNCKNVAPSQFLVS